MGSLARSLEGSDFLEMSMYTEDSGQLAIRRRANLQFYHLYTPKHFPTNTSGFYYTTPESFEVDIAFDHGPGLDSFSATYVLEDQAGGQQYAPQCILETGVQSWN